jgi:hypothetical protein
MQGNYRGNPRSTENRLTLDEDELLGLMITKQAYAKSLIESGQIKECTTEAQKIIEDWIEWTYKNTEHEKKLITPDTPF